MPYFRQQTYSAAATTPSWNLDPAIAPFEANVVCTLSAGTVSYKLQYTLSSLYNPTAVDSDAIWVDSLDIPAATAASAVSRITSPVARIRLVIATLSGGTLTMQVRQGLSIN